MVDEVGSDEHPCHIEYKPCEAGDFKVARMKEPGVQQLTEGNDYNDLSSLSHHLLKRVLKGLMQSKGWAATQFSLVRRIDSRALGPELYEDNKQGYYTLCSKTGQHIRVCGFRRRLLIGVRLLVAVWFRTRIVLDERSLYRVTSKPQAIGGADLRTGTLALLGGCARMLIIKLT